MLNAQSMQTGDTRTARLVKSVLALLQFPRWLSYLSRRQKRKKHGLEINTNHFLQTGMPTHWEQDIVCCARHDRLQAVTFTLSPNFVRWCGWHFNQRMSFKPHCDKARWHTETKRELWVGYDMAEQAQHPFRVFFFLPEQHWGQVWVICNAGKRFIYRFAMIPSFPQSFSSTLHWEARDCHGAMENIDLQYNSPRHSYLRSEKKTSSWEKTKRPNRPPANVLS